MNLDEDFRVFMHNIPEAVKSASPGKPGCSRVIVAFKVRALLLALPKVPILILREQCLLTCGIHSQLIKLHMPYLYRSFKNPRFQRSYDICIASAEAVIASERDYSLITREQRYWWAYVQLFAAVLCLLLDALRLTDKARSERLIEERLATILLALPVFENAQRTARIPHSKRIGYVGSYGTSI